MQTSLEPYQTTEQQRTQDAAHRLARYLTHATKTGVSPSECRGVLLALLVDASHPHAAPIQLRMPYHRDTETVYIDTSRLPCDHGRIDHTPALLNELQAAHRLLMLALSCMTDQQQATFAAQSERMGLGTDGATRHHERAAVIAMATGMAA